MFVCLLLPNLAKSPLKKRFLVLMKFICSNKGWNKFLLLSFKQWAVRTSLISFYPTIITLNFCCLPQRVLSQFGTLTNVSDTNDFVLILKYISPRLGTSCSDSTSIKGWQTAIWARLFGRNQVDHQTAESAADTINLTEVSSTSFVLHCMTRTFPFKSASFNIFFHCQIFKFTLNWLLI